MPMYQGLVEMYTCRYLTYDSDILRAFAGVSSAIEKVSKSTFLLGMPQAIMASALLWAHKSLALRRVNDEKEARYPSWCWAGWVGDVVYPPIMRGFSRGFYEEKFPEIDSFVMVNVKQVGGGLVCLERLCT